MGIHLRLWGNTVYVPASSGRHPASAKDRDLGAEDYGVPRLARKITIVGLPHLCLSLPPAYPVSVPGIPCLFRCFGSPLFGIRAPIPYTLWGKMLKPGPAQTDKRSERMGFDFT